MLSAISREKALKDWKRKWKITLIEKKTHIGEICIRVFYDRCLQSHDINRKYVLQRSSSLINF